ncbi:MAG: L-threonylcarbamoyladenylate synthase [Coriobacteriia bacterium]|nr:L-threonylcarbamoyladenylate synthase [Coriobacteriia bacterium]
MNKVIHVDPENPSAEVVNLAATLLKDGGIIVFPTETVYGIGASATSCIGSQEIIDIKMRPKNKPLPWLVDGEDALETYGVDVPDYAHRLARAFWPGALTIVVKAADIVAKEFRDDRDTVALRSPDHPLVRELIRSNGAAVVTTSANTSGEPPATSFEELEERIIAAADIVLDGGETPHKLASTVVDCTGPEPVVTRVGPISEAEVMAAAQAQ